MRCGPRGCRNVGVRKLHDRANRTLGQTIERVHMWRRRCGMDGAASQELGEFARDEFSGVVSMDGADGPGRNVAPLEL
eukprot:1368839-Pleurochrysis_carterae.AAC.9